MYYRAIHSEGFSPVEKDGSEEFPYIPLEESADIQNPSAGTDLNRQPQSADIHPADNPSCTTQDETQDEMRQDFFIGTPNIGTLEVPIKNPSSARDPNFGIDRAGYRGKRRSKWAGPEIRGVS